MGTKRGTPDNRKGAGEHHNIMGVFHGHANDFSYRSTLFDPPNAEGFSQRGELKCFIPAPYFRRHTVSEACEGGESDRVPIVRCGGCFPTVPPPPRSPAHCRLRKTASRQTAFCRSALERCLAQHRVVLQPCILKSAPHGIACRRSPVCPGHLAQAHRRQVCA